MAVLVTALVIPFGGACFAAASEETPAAQGDAVTSLLTVQERLDAIEKQKGESEAYLTELNGQLTDLTDELTELQEQYSQKRIQLDLLTQQLRDAEDTAENQRENMALRIQYMYENSTGNGLLENVFSSDNFQHILMSSVNIHELAEFDRQMLDEYVAVCEEIEAKRAAVEEEQKEIGKLEDQSSDKRAEIQLIYEETLSDIDTMEASLEEGHEEEARLLEEIRKQEEELAVWLTPAQQQVAYADAYALQYVQPAAGTGQPAASGMPTADTGAGETAAAETADGTAAAGTADGAPAAQDTASGTAGTETAGAQDTAAAAADTTAAGASAETASTAPASQAPASNWDGPVLTRLGGVNQGPTGKETYYNLNMSGVVSIMRDMGNSDPYWVRDDGVKMLGDYVMVAADLQEHPRGSIVESSLGTSIVVDTGCLEKDQLDIAVAW